MPDPLGMNSVVCVSGPSLNPDALDFVIGGYGNRYLKRNYLFCGNHVGFKTLDEALLFKFYGSDIGLLHIIF